MTTINRAFTEELHPRGTGALGGQFVAAGSSTAAKKTAPPARKAAPPAKKGAKPAQKPASGGGGNLAFDGKRGPGYGKKGGDKRVRGLQEALNRLGLTDGSGKKLAVDGKLGPRTTAAIKKAQRAAGMKADGVVTPAFLAQLAKTKSAKDLKAKKKTVPEKKPAPKKTTPPAKKAPARPVKPAKRVAQPRRIDVSRSSVSYSGRMTEMARHLPGRHNQASHGNRIGKATNIAGRTGHSRAAEAARVGTSDARLDDEVEIVSPEGSTQRGGNIGKRGTVIDAEEGHFIVELDDGTQVGDLQRRNVKVTRTRWDKGLEKERRDKLDAESAKARENGRKARERQQRGT